MAAKVLTSWERLGVIRNRHGDSLIVDEYRWADAPYNAKVSMALAFYCDPGLHDGRDNVFVRGYRDNDIKASVIDGNYWD